DRADDQVGVTFAQARGVEAESRARAGRRGVEPDIGIRRELVEPRPTIVGVEIDPDAALARVQRVPGEAAVDAGHPADPWPAVAQGLPLRRLDRDHVGAEVAQDLAGELARFVAQVEDADAVEHGGREYNRARMKIGITMFATDLAMSPVELACEAE